MKIFEQIKEFISDNPILFGTLCFIGLMLGLVGAVGLTAVCGKAIYLILLWTGMVAELAFAITMGILLIAIIVFLMVLYEVSST